MSAPNPKRGYYYDPTVTDDERRSRLQALLLVRPTVSSPELLRKIDDAVDRLGAELGRP